MTFLGGLLSSDAFMPHGYCYLWTPGLVWLHVGSDSLIALAYSSIPITLLYFIRRRKDLPFDWMFVCFGLFILACGATHAMEVWTVWHATYWLAGSVKLVTAVVSVTTAVLLVDLVPRALALPSPDTLKLEIAQRTLAEQALSRANGRLIQAHEEERTRIARDLHDDVAQRITLLSLHLDGIVRDGRERAAHFGERLDEARRQVRELGNEIQALSHRLHSSKLEYLGLATAADGFCTELSERSGIRVDFQSMGVPEDLAEDAALCLFRVLQEAVQNATKHSGSRHVEVTLEGVPNEVRLRVRDGGSGFDPDRALKGRGLGLISMKERLKLAGGDLSIESRPGVGTTIRAHVPATTRSGAPAGAMRSA